MYFRAYRFMAKGLASTDHPILAHVIPMRRCNLACSYCNEYDDYSSPVPADIVTLGLAQNLVDDPIAAESEQAHLIGFRRAHGAVQEQALVQQDLGGGDVHLVTNVVGE